MHVIPALMMRLKEDTVQDLVQLQPQKKQVDLIAI
jgi:hypothetical protein